mmetsp:Transcript_5938/g.23028  ORF Transcript_5938/g.23028 Transcript_5938/m.23028 type:complete len:273 (+) Transcript_5938:873-1691(+)
MKRSMMLYFGGNTGTSCSCTSCSLATSFLDTSRSSPSSISSPSSSMSAFSCVRRQRSISCGNSFSVPSISTTCSTPLRRSGSRTGTCSTWKSRLSRRLWNMSYQLLLYPATAPTSAIMLEYSVYVESSIVLFEVRKMFCLRRLSKASKNRTASGAFTILKGTILASRPCFSAGGTGVAVGSAFFMDAFGLAGGLMRVARPWQSLITSWMSCIHASCSACPEALRCKVRVGNSTSIVFANAPFAEPSRLGPSRTARASVKSSIAAALESSARL